MKIETKYVHAQNIFDNMTEFEKDRFELNVLRIIERVALNKSDESGAESMAMLNSKFEFDINHKNYT